MEENIAHFLSFVNLSRAGVGGFMEVALATIVSGPDWAWFAEAVQPMAQAQNRMPPQHARAGITHHHLDLLAPGALIAMDWHLTQTGFSTPNRHRSNRTAA